MTKNPAWLARLLSLPGAVSFDRFGRVVTRAGLLAPSVEQLSDAEFKHHVAAVRLVTGGRLQPDATARFLALAREAASRSLGLRPYDEQLLACCALLCGHAVEMDTGEGKTLVGALAAAGHAVSSRDVHVLSINDYLAERDAIWMQPFFELMGFSVGWVGQHTAPRERQRAYLCNIVYAPVSEIGFDVLRDRFSMTDEERMAPRFDVAIVDEADAVMIDDAMMPLVLAGSSPDEADDFAEATALVDRMTEGRDYLIDSDRATVSLTDEGLNRLEAELGGINLYSIDNIDILTRVNLALNARVLVQRDVDYLVEGQTIKLINTARGRVAHLQRWPDGLHAAVEAKERLSISTPGVVLDTITIQDLLLSYKTLSGMGGTVVAVAEDLIEFYKVPTGRVRRNRPNIRLDAPPRVYVTENEKLAAIVGEVMDRHRTGQPVLVGTQSVEESERLAGLLREREIGVRVLNARNDAEEAAIVARAGEIDAVTISTQMSGRGTDVRLGGMDGHDRDAVTRAGGLAVIAAGRYPSSRLDAQLRGRAGRQGDPGSSSSHASLDDDLVQGNAPAHLLAEVARLGNDMPGSRRRRIVDTSQAIAEGIRLERHRATWAYSRAIAAQRRAVLEERSSIIEGNRATAVAKLLVSEHLGSLEADAGTVETASTVRAVSVHYLDEHWVQHLSKLQNIRDGIHLQALAGHRPADEFHRIALHEFQGFFDAVYDDAAQFLKTLTATDVTRDVQELGLRRPSATWTYMVTDDPYGSPGDRLARELGRHWRSKVLKIE